jgi:xanthine dehydrogenase accessory factor
MKEIRAIITAYDKIDRASTQAALATVVRVEGSSYRRTGARMLVMDNGHWIGGISGGCLEGDALNRARLAILKSESSLITYDTTEDDPHQIGVGLGCNGIIDVLFTPLDFQNKLNPVEILKFCLQANRQTHVLLTILGLKGDWKRAKVGDLISFRKPEDLHIFEDTQLEQQLLALIEEQCKSSKSAPHHFELPNGRELSLFIEFLPPEVQLILMGHQYDIYPLAKLIQEIGWRSSVVANLLKVNSKILSSTDNVYGYDQFDTIPIDPYTAILLMSHDYKTDKMNLSRALHTDASYIGMLGPRVRAEKIFAELENEGYPISERDKKRIYAPAGLDIGALTPEEIALALIAEIRSVLSKREGGFLRLRQTTIHERI